MVDFPVHFYWSKSCGSVASIRVESKIIGDFNLYAANDLNVSNVLLS